MFTDVHVKCLMAALIYSQMGPIDDSEVCEFDMATSLAEELYDHVVAGSHGPSEPTWMAPVDPSEKGN